VLVVGVASLVGLLDRVSSVFELADVFRLQYLVLLAGAALAALVLRRPNKVAALPNVHLQAGGVAQERGFSCHARHFDSTPLPEGHA
jgi:hypothetical protein